MSASARSSLPARVGVGGPRTDVPRYSGATAIAFGLLTAIALGAVLAPWFATGARLQAGQLARWTLVAPRAVSYDSTVRTNEVRGEAARAVPDVLVLDPGIRERQLAELDRQLGEVRRLRADGTLAASARETTLRAILGVALSQPAAQQLLAVTSPELDAMVEEARAALGRILSGTVQESELAAARRRATGFLSPLLPPAQAQVVEQLLAPLIVPTLTVDAVRTSMLRAGARKGQPPVHISYARGDVLLHEGQPVTAFEIELLGEAGLRSSNARPSDVAAAVLVAALAGVAAGGYLLVAQPTALASGRRRLLFIVLLVLPALVAKLAMPVLLPDHERHFLMYALPIAAAPMAAAGLLDLGAAVLLTALLASIASFIVAYLPLAQGDSTMHLEAVRAGMAIVASSLGGVLVSAQAARRYRYLAAGFVAALGAGLALLAVWLIDANRGWVDLAWIAGACAVGGLFAALITVGVFVLLSRPFGIVTRVELMELSQLHHPLLRRLQDEVPGTFQHSVLVGNLAERAADRIGADALLVRIGAYYHDVGKLVAPPFFVENGSEEDPHAALDPLQSTRVILRHVTGGVEIARHEGLPEVVVAFVPQHHGTRLVQFFYRRAATLDAEIDPELFRYPGPKPQTREAALVMLADGTEATVRASNDRSRERIHEIIETVIRERVEEGQFDECDLSLRDLRAVADSFATTLNAVYHPRVVYPAPTEREIAGRRVGLVVAVASEPLPPTAVPPPAGRAAPRASEGFSEDTL